MLLHQEENLRFINLENAEEFSRRKTLIILEEGRGAMRSKKKEENYWIHTLITLIHQNASLFDTALGMTNT